MSVSLHGTSIIMGQDIDSLAFQDCDVEHFRRRLEDETLLARRMFAQGAFDSAGRCAGFELEAWLVDHNHYPQPCNQRVLARLADPLVVPELSQFNIELNGTPQPLKGAALSQLAQELTATWGRCVRAAHEEGATVMAIGTLPTLRESDLTLAHMSPTRRYAALNEQVLKARGGRPLTLNIEGRESLSTTHADVMLEAASTSFQVHLQVPAEEVSRHLNASILLSGPLVALAANSPFLFGRALWHETRIPLFEQSVDCGVNHPERNRVTFGEGYLGADPIDYFGDHEVRYPVLLPLCSEEPVESFAHLRLHNGTVWSWNRLLIGWDARRQPHLRIEQRVMPAGPSVVDMMANAAFYYGVVHMLARQHQPPESLLPFEQARDNFYRSAREGLDAGITWLHGRRQSVLSLLEQHLLPLAREGLQDMAVDAQDIDRYLDVIAARLRTRQNGAVWQLSHHARHGDLFKLTADYQEHQRSG
ncbi:MAG TPA: glutamate-cysteine ligase family protein, partial [Aquabacterium sp.]|nr:glutamate-cysteine ligase family protein [Aquabacterium sp.]